MERQYSMMRGQCLKWLKPSLVLGVLSLVTASPTWASCSYTITNNWGTGFTAEVKVTNDTAQSVSNWSVAWKEPSATVSNAWNATLSGSNPYTVTALSWNANLAPQASATFGFQAVGTAGAPQVTGSLCGASASSVSSVKSSASSISSLKSSVASSSSIKSSSSSSKSSSSVPVTEASLVFEENGVGFCNASSVVKNTNAGYTSAGYADTENVDGATLSWSVSAASAKTYAVDIRFANGSGSARTASVLVNDSDIQSVSFANTGVWTTWQTLRVNLPLNSGINSVKLVASSASGLPNIDNVTIIGNGIAPAACPSTPVEPAATPDCNSITNQPILNVAADGSAQYKTVAAALNTISSSNTTQTQIRIKPGTYREKLTISKPFVTFCGEAGKQASTVLTYNDGASTLKSDGTTVGTSGSASITIAANDISVENITIENAFGQGSQAVALLARGERLQFRNCRLLGYQDTLYAHSGTQYYRNCHIQGSVDFIFGGATAIFDNNTIHSVAGGTALTAPSTEQTTPYGLVFLGGKVTAVSSVSKGSVALGRNWRPYGATAYIRTDLGQHISAVGWVPMGTNTLDTARFSEYMSTGAGANASARASQSKQLSASQAAAYTVSNIFGSWTPSYSK